MSRHNAQQSAVEPGFSPNPPAAEIVDLQSYLPSQHWKKAKYTLPQTTANQGIVLAPDRWLLTAQSIGVIALTLMAVLCELLQMRAGAELLSHWHLWGLTQKFNFDSADSLPNFFQTVTMLLSTHWLWLITKVKQTNSDAYVNYWRMLTVTFFLLALDEATNFHTMTAKPFREMLQASHFLYFTWVVWGMAFALLFVAAYYKFLRALPALMRNQLLFAGAIFLCGAVGLEMVGGQLQTVYGAGSSAVAVGIIVEEVLEMSGVWLFNYALLNYLLAQMPTTQIQHAQ